ncbi:MAG: 50S ribosomal protein L15 [Phycisphaerales bacterium]|nr:MAG: 50S ribosomal protein L15 [Phycisphaerales bacterium]
MMIHEITEKVGKYKARKRLGRGDGSGHGKTSGRGHKGAGSRAGYKRRPYFEGGQMSFIRRMPKRGFSNARFRRPYHIVNLKTLDARLEDGAVVTPETLVEAGIIRDTDLPLKVLGEGDLTKKLQITAAKFSASAKAKIEAAGGAVTEVAKVKWTRPRATKAGAQKKEKAGNP